MTPVNLIPCGVSIFIPQRAQGQEVEDKGPAGPWAVLTSYYRNSHPSSLYVVSTSAAWSWDWQEGLVRRGWVEEAKAVLRPPGAA